MGLGCGTGFGMWGLGVLAGVLEWAGGLRLRVLWDKEGRLID